ncbi:MAG: response regulator [Patescibacteria group bacterium]|nr:response regulator [Patescibacteria group bacterium]MDD5716154.1 response regulator [Patescibacteria group bacterium]
MAQHTQKVLVIEDDHMLSRLIAKALMAAGLSVLEAANGKVGIELARRKRPDCILLDVIMPKVDGVTVMHEIRKTPAGKRIPIIYWTNVPKTELMSSVAQGTVHYMSKANHSLQELVRTVVSLVAKG